MTAPRFELEVPGVVDVGWIPTDETVTIDFELRNTGETEVRLTGVLVPPSNPRQVALRPVLAERELSSGESALVTVSIFAEAEPPGQSLGRIQIGVAGLPPGDERIPVVDILGQVSPSGLVAEPNPIAIGPVPFLQTRTATVGIRNIRSTAVDVYSLSFRGGRAQYEEAVTRGRFGELPRISGLGFLTRLEPEEVFVVDLSYTAPASVGEAKEQAIWTLTTCLEEPACGLSIFVQGLLDSDGSRVWSIPRGSLNFGQVPLGVPVERTLRIGNEGRRDLQLTEGRFVGSNAFSLRFAESITVPPGNEFSIDVTYLPTGQTVESGTLSFRTNDVFQPEFSVSFSGSGGGSAALSRPGDSVFRGLWSGRAVHPARPRSSGHELGTRAVSCRQPSDYSPRGDLRDLLRVRRDPSGLGPPRAGQQHPLPSPLRPHRGRAARG